MSARSNLTILACGVLGLLLILPLCALGRLSVWIDLRLLLGVPLVISLLTFFAYRSDKQRAETGAQRIPESALHLVELLGGWPGAYLAQRVVHHKNSKFSYQTMFWIIVAAEQYLALDFLIHWKLAKAVLHLLKH